MKIAEIKDDNSLVEVYIHYLLTHLKVEVDPIGYTKDDLSFRIYYIWDKQTNNYMLLITDLDKYYSKLAKKKITKEKRSSMFLYPMEEDYKKVNEKTFEAVMEFFDGKNSDLCLDFTQNFVFVKEYLKNP
jgi:hypothetical protein